MKRNLFIYLSILLFVFYAPIQAQKSITTQEQTIENKVRLNELEKKVDAQEHEMQSVSDKKQTSLEAKFELKKENLESRSNWVNYLLGILGILIAFFGIGIPIAAFYYGRKFLKEIDEEKEKAKKELEIFKEDFKENLVLLIKNSKERIQLLEEKAQVSITNLCNYEKQGKDTANNIIDIENKFKSLIESMKDPDLTIENKENLASEAKELSVVEGLSDYEKEYARALELYYKGDFQNALDKFLFILNSYPDKITMDKLLNIYFNVAYVYGELNDQDNSIIYYNKVISIKSNHEIAWNNLGVNNNKKKLYDESIRCYQKAIEIKPDYYKAYINLGNLYFYKEDYVSALESYKKVSEFKPDYAIAWSNMASCYSKENDYEKSIDCYKKAIVYDNKSKRNYSNLIELLLFSKQYDDAERLLQELKLIDLNDGKQSKIFNIKLLEILYLVISNKSHKDINESIIDLKTAVNNDSGSITWSFNEINKWLGSKKSEFLKEEQREFIIEFIRLIEDWRAEDKKVINYISK